MKGLEFPEVFPRLQTDRLLLREITPDDREGIFKNFSDVEVARWFFEEPYTDMEQVDQIIKAFITEFEQAKGLTWAMILTKNSEFVGTCGYGEIDLGSRGELGFDLAKEHWGKGLMSEALGAVTAYGFDVLGLSRVEAHTYSANSRAIRLLRKMGFQVESVQGDSHHFSLAKQDWASLK